MRAVNLLPSEPSRRRKKMPSGQVLLASTAPLVAGTLVYLAFSFEQSKVSSARADLGVAADRARRSPAARCRRCRQHRSSRARRRSGSSPWRTRSAAASRGTGFSTRSPASCRQNIWLTQLNALSPTPTTPAPPPAPTTTTSSGSSSSSSTAATTVVPAAPSAIFTITGYAYSHDDVAHLLARLALVPSLTDVTLGSTSSASVGAKAVVQFTVTATMQAGPGS